MISELNVIPQVISGENETHTQTTTRPNHAQAKDEGNI